MILTPVLYPFVSCWLTSFLLCAAAHLNITECQAKEFFLLLPNTESACILKNHTKWLTDETHGAGGRVSSFIQQHSSLPTAHLFCSLQRLQGHVYSQLGSDPHCSTSRTNTRKTLTLSWENTRKTTEKSQVITSTQTENANGQIAGEGKKIKEKKLLKNVQESIHYEFQFNCLLVWTWFEVLGINFLPLLQLLETYGIEGTAYISSSSHVQPQCSETQFYVILASFWVEFSVAICRKKLC